MILYSLIRPLSWIKSATKFHSIIKTLGQLLPFRFAVSASTHLVNFDEMSATAIWKKLWKLQGDPASFRWAYWAEQPRWIMGVWI